MQTIISSKQKLQVILLFITVFCATAAMAAKPGNIPDNNLTITDSLKQINAGLLNVGYIEAGPSKGQPVILLHGWPYGINSYSKAAAILAEKGYHVFVPYARGFGSTRFLSAGTPRSGQPGALAQDLLDFMDALHIQKAIIGGFDWGARTADIIAALHPERCTALVAVSGYLIGNPKTAIKPLSPKAELSWWYQFYFATERGELGYKEHTRDFAKLIWQLASPDWKFDEATFNQEAKSFDNPDHVAIVIHNYRYRLGLVKGEKNYAAIESRLAGGPAIHVPTVTLEGDANGAPHPSPDAYRNKYTGKYKHHTITGGIGHDLPEEAPAAFANAIIEADAMASQR
ncbi:alpha/beta hydrolase [Arachidicoccus terrestris]|uniref:alpha/beta hydrolase n=1 Tax=Arachidicoccus terrestris TaxID=2875539 RepID=UPI001CC7C325|nr:alpha/beta hydrolase [Arachidicoccus terrestris]